MSKARPIKPVKFQFAKLLDGAPDDSAYWMELLDIALGEMESKMEADLKHFESEILEHEKGEVTGKYNKDKWHHSGQVGAYKHIVLHVKAWLLGIKQERAAAAELSAKYEAAVGEKTNE